MCSYKYVIITCFVIPTVLLCIFVFVCNPKDSLAVRMDESHLLLVDS